jgi:uncharacterized Fe-S cluster-containing radical SAM superfamily protein
VSAVEANTGVTGAAPPPLVAITHLDDLWFQAGGTLCNFTCLHCFISCSPHNRSFRFLTLQELRRYLAESVPLGVKEYYFTGGEPFLNPDLVPMLAETLGYGPATVLTNASVLRDAWLQELADAERGSVYSLEFRVSLDGFSAESNDAIRGPGTFERTMEGLGRLAAYGFLPLITAVRTWPIEEEPAVLDGFRRLLRRRGIARPRFKVLPPLRLGAEVQRTGGYAADERVTAEMLEVLGTSHLPCEHSRIVTDRGVHVCPILIAAADSLLGDTLAEALVPYRLRHGACHTCVLSHNLCANPTAGR